MNHKGGKVMTRAQKKSLKSRRRSYRRHSKNSSCKGLSMRTCRRKPGCTVAKGSKRNFCRTSKNTHTRKQRGGNVMTGAMSALKEATLPLLMLVGQKQVQRNLSRRRRRN